jgi:DNA-binding beta-propeller fold protein YncE
MKVPHAITAAAMLLCAIATSGSVPAQTAGAKQEVTTLAGTGVAGINDGPAATATFLMPTGLARSADGTLYIADEAAQRIRTLSGGVVRTFAGSGPVGPTGLSVLGGYRDGPALEAQFNRPAGLALGADGALYVADSNNFCIRKIKAGIVSTYSGKCGAKGEIDGAAADVRWKDPRSLAFDGEGNLWVADYDLGIRKIDKSGTVSTLHTKSIGDRRVWSLTISGLPNDPTLLAATPDWVIVAHLNTNTDVPLNVKTGAEGNRPFGSAGQLAAIDTRQYVFTDKRSSTIRYLRLPAPPFATTDFTRVIAGGRLERQIDNAGFADGSYADSRFFAPSGIVLGDGYAYVADTGNRRIRRVLLPSSRVSESGLADVAPYDASRYQIAYIGASWAYWDSLDRDSICGQLESNLDAGHRFAKAVRCHPIRIDAATFAQIEDYLSNYLPPHVDLVVINMTLAEAYSLFADSSPPSLDVAVATFKKHVEALKSKLGPHTKLMLFWTFDADDVSDAENLWEREINARRRSLPDVIFENYTIASKAIIDGVNEPGIYSCDSYPDFLAYEKQNSPGPLYGTDDSHLSPRGSAFAAGILARCIEAHQDL